MSESDFCLRRAAVLAQLCVAAYEQATFDVGESQVLVTNDGDQLVLAFRGTEPRVLADWLTDFRVQRVSTIVGEVHSGFWAAFLLVWGKVLKAVVDAKKDDPLLKVFVTGHSMGGAMACIAAVMLVQHGVRVDGLYTFGAPRAFDTQGAENADQVLAGKAFRVVNNNDVVTRVPPRTMDFRHFGELRYIDWAGVVHSDAEFGWWRRFWDRIEGRFEDVTADPFDGISDHSMVDDYAPLLSKAVVDGVDVCQCPLS